MVTCQPTVNLFGGSDQERTAQVPSTHAEGRMKASGVGQIWATAIMLSRTEQRNTMDISF